MKTKLAIGDTVRIKPHKIGRCKEKGCIGFQKFWKVCVKDIGKIIGYDKGDGTYSVKGDGNLWLSPCMLEKVEDTRDRYEFVPDGGVRKIKKPPQPKEERIIEIDGQKFQLSHPPVEGSISVIKTKMQPKECIHEWRIEQILNEVGYGLSDTGAYVQYAYLLCTKCPTVKKVLVNI